MLKFFSTGSTDTIKNVKYTVNDLIFRLKKLQKVCIKDNLDAIMLINGIDSKDNEEYTKLTNWLLLGQSGLEVLESEFL